jgi:hypothetical protein
MRDASSLMRKREKVINFNLKFGWKKNEKLDSNEKSKNQTSINEIAELNIFLSSFD